MGCGCEHSIDCEVRPLQVTVADMSWGAACSRGIEVSEWRAVFGEVKLGLSNQGEGRMRYECERRRRIDASADVVWHWMSDVRRLLCLNLFHAEVEAPVPVEQAGAVIPIRHNIAWLYREVRLTRIHTYRKYEVGWGELQASGTDRCPHSQFFTIIPVDTHHCIVVNRLRGKFIIPGARYWFMPVYRWIAPQIMDHENRQIAAAVAALQAETVD